MTQAALNNVVISKIRRYACMSDFAVSQFNNINCTAVNFAIHQQIEGNLKTSTQTGQVAIKGTGHGILVNFLNLQS